VHEPLALSELENVASKTLDGITFRPGCGTDVSSDTYRRDRGVWVVAKTFKVTHSELVKLVSTPSTVRLAGCEGYGPPPLVPPYPQPRLRSSREQFPGGMEAGTLLRNGLKNL